jgi:protein SCO1/2
MNKLKFIFPLAFLCYLIFSGCEQAQKTLPVIGNRIDLDGSEVIHNIRPFSFISQMGDTITNQSVAGKIYMTDFFFTSCPSICPKVKKQMLRIYDKVKGNKDILLISHTIDPKRDSVKVLKTYADNLGIDHTRWLFLTGAKEELLDIADDYFVAAYEDPDAPGGFDHSGKIILLDKSGKIRSFCDGTDPESVDRFMEDIFTLLKEYEQ